MSTSLRGTPTGTISTLAVPEYAPDRLIVKLNADSVKNFATDANITSTQDVNSTGAKILHLAPNVDIDAVMAQYKASGLFDYVEPDYIIKLDSVSTKLPNDPSLASEWALNNTGQLDSDGFAGVPDADIDAPEAWATQTGNPNFVIGVIDTGVDITHPDLVNNIYTNPGEVAGNAVDDDHNGYIDDVHGWNFVANNNTPIDGNGHGTHVSGTIAAEGNNGIGVTGVAWNAKIMPLKFLSDAGSGYTSDAVLAINYATMMGVKITNNSWGGGGFSQSLMDAISAANVKGDLFIAAAGNSGLNTDINVSYPAGYNLPNIISVAASDNWDWMASFSNYGATTVDLAAPGYNIYSTFPVTFPAGNTHVTNYGSISGTSMASPQVAGAAAVVWSQFPFLTAQQVKDSLMSTVDHPDYSNSAPLTGAVPAAANLAGKTVSGGRLNLNNALASNNNNSPVGTEDITGTATQNETLTATDSFTDADGLGVISHQWKADNVNIAGATSNTLALTQAQVGKVISVVASYTDGKGTLETVSSNVTTAVVNVNDLPTGSVNIIIPSSQTAPKVGDVLQMETASVQDIDGLGVFGNQWKVTSNGNTTDIVGATASTYTVTTTDLGKAISATVSYSDGFNTPEHVDSNVTTAVNNNNSPVGTEDITGTATQNETLTATDSFTDADGLGVISHQWKADNANIAGATSNTLALTQAQVGKVISVVASYTDGKGALETVSSNVTTAVANVNDLPTGSVNITIPSSQTAPKVGDVLQIQTASVQDVDGLGTFNNQWKITSNGNTTDIVGATASTYTVTTTDLGKAISTTVSYIDGFNTPEHVDSGLTGVVYTSNVGNATGAVNITGTVKQGSILTADISTIKDVNGYATGVPLAQFSYQWYATDIATGSQPMAIQNAISKTYTLTQSQVGKKMSVVASFTDLGTPPTLENKTSSATIGVVNVNDLPTGSVTITGRIGVDETLTANNTLVDIDGMGTVSYQWKAAGVIITGATSNTYVIASAAFGKAITVEASYIDGSGTLEKVTSAAVTTLIVGTINNDSVSGTAAADVIDALAGNDSVSGLAGNDYIYGREGNDTLNGGLGNDTLDGGLGNDTFYVDAAGDVIVEAVDEGIDTVSSSVSYSLAGTQLENLTLTGTIATLATGNDVANILLGNASANTLVGAAGSDLLNGGAGNDSLDGGNDNDTLNGGAGIDQMNGGIGDDTFYVDVAGDVMGEDANAGIDTVISSVSYSLVGTQLENLTLTGTAATLATGNDFANILLGNASANTLVGAAGSDLLNGGAGNDSLDGGANNDTLDGGAGSDRMNGGVGDDTFYVDVAGDVIVENAASGNDTVISSVSYSLVGTQLENLTLTGAIATLVTGNNAANILVGNALANMMVGGGGADILRGGAGNDTLDGGAGKDALSGGDGQDVFVLSNSYTVDSIADFISTDDKIQLKSAWFESLPKGVLSADMFKVGDSNVASDENDSVIYNSSTGALYYDDDGSLGDAAPVQIAILASLPVLTASNFIIV